MRSILVVMSSERRAVGVYQRSNSLEPLPGLRLTPLARTTFPEECWNNENLRELELLHHRPLMKKIFKELHHAHSLRTTISIVELKSSFGKLLNMARNSML